MGESALRPSLTPYDEDSKIPLEIERKYLLLADLDLEAPELEGAERLEIETTFLARKGSWKGRVRRVESAAGERYLATRKRRLSGIVQEEDEREITRAEYEALKVKADPSRAVVKKTRYKFPCEGRVWELDVYQEPKAPPRLEVELRDAAEAPEPPAFLGPVAEVSLEPGFSDRRLAKAGAERAWARHEELAAALPQAVRAVERQPDLGL